VVAPAQAPDTAVAAALLEREEELARIARAVDDAAGGRGGVVVIEGGAGMGKTSLVAAALRHAAARSLGVLAARGSELERDLGFGVVRRLLDPRRGAQARTAAPPRLSSGDALDRSFAVLHELHLVLSELADARPHVLAVDDAHWADAASQRWLAYVGHRLEGVPVLVVVAARPVEDWVATPVRDELLDLAGDAVLRPRALGAAAVAALVTERLGETPDAFAAACHRATGGNPLALVELLRSVPAEALPPTAQLGATLADRAPARLARHVLARVRRAGTDAQELARALAILGEDTPLRRAAALAGLPVDAAADAADALVDEEILVTARPLHFVHPLVRAAVHDELPEGARSRAHARAARLLADEGAGPEAVAAHLLACEPGGRPQVVEVLRAAAARACEEGAPEAAVTYLRRAVAEPPAADLPRVLRELGAAEAARGDRGAVDHLRRAYAAERDPAVRAAVAGELCQVLTSQMEWDDAVALGRTALADLGDRDPQGTLRLEAAVAVLTWQDERWVDDFSRDVPRLRALAAHPGSAARPLALALAGAVAARGGATAEALGLADRGLDRGAFLVEEAADHIGASQAVNAYLFCERPDRALALTGAMMADSRRRGSVLNLVTGSLHQGLARLRVGELAEAEAALRLADELSREHGYVLAEPFSLGYLAQVLAARGTVGELAERLEAFPLAGLPSSAHATIHHARALARLARGDRAGAVADLRAVGSVLATLRLENPAVLDWRAALATLLAADAPDQARALAEEDLRQARASGLRACEGVALRARAAVSTGSERVELLRDAAERLGATPYRLEHARALVELGAALRAAGGRTDAREVLKTALDLAWRCGARPLAERARVEAVAAGARPRRPVLSGREALTPSELRAARLAADGLSNREIAQALFITRKTVGDHLGAAYRKLGIAGRAGLAAALDTQG